MTTAFRPIANLAAALGILLHGSTAAFGAEPSPETEVVKPDTTEASGNTLEASLECVSKDKGLARELFFSGAAKIDANDWQGGCGEIAASVQQHCSPSALSYLSKCLVNNRRLFAAKRVTERALELLEQRGVNTIEATKIRLQLREALATTTSQIPRLRVTVTPVEVEPSLSIDGTRYQANESVAVDPGSHEIVVSADGYATQSRAVQVLEGTEHSIGFALLPSTLGIAPGAPFAQADTGDAKSGLSTRRQVALGMAAGGLVSLGVAAVFGLKTRSFVNQAKNECSAGWICNEHGVDLLSHATQTQNWGIGLAVFGAVGIGAGALLWTTERHSTQERSVATKLELDVGPGALRVRGAW